MAIRSDDESLNALMDECESSIAYRFHDRDLLQLTLTHASVARTRLESNERLEFLGDRVLGFVDFDAARAYVHYLFVAPEAQGRGIGLGLVDAVQAACGERPIELSCWAVNDTSLAWYLRHGFTITGGGLTEVAGLPVVRIDLARPARR